MAPSADKQSKMGLFLGWMFLAWLLVLAVLFALWIVSCPGLRAIYRYLPAIIGGIIFLVGVVCLVGLVSMTLATKGFPYPSLLRRFNFGLIRLLFPFAVRMARLFGVDQRRIERSFISVSNALVFHGGLKVRPSELLLLAPHCLQRASCLHKITFDPANCRRCGECNIGELVQLAEEQGFHFLVATGGTLARQFVKKVRPKAVLAIACERDLMSGIQDIYPIPGVGVLNQRPNGPCFNTRVDMEAVKQVVEKMTAAD